MVLVSGLVWRAIALLSSTSIVTTNPKKRHEYNPHHFFLFHGVALCVSLNNTYISRRTRLKHKAYKHGNPIQSYIN